jgi:hypothetical protein
LDAGRNLSAAVLTTWQEAVVGSSFYLDYLPTSVFPASSFFSGTLKPHTLYWHFIIFYSYSTIFT